MKRVVLDTNVVISALIVPVGKPAQIFKHLDDLTLLTSEPILIEVQRVLHYPRIQKRYSLSDETVNLYLERVREVSTLVKVEREVSVIKDDPDGDKFLACAVDGKAEYIVSGDPHLLKIGEYEGIKIVAPSYFLALLSAPSD